MYSCCNIKTFTSAFRYMKDCYMSTNLQFKCIIKVPRQRATCIIRPQRMHKMRTTAIDDPDYWSRASVSLSVTLLYAGLRCAIPLNGSRSCLEWRLLVTQETLCYTEVPISPPIRRDLRQITLLWPLVFMRTKSCDVASASQEIK